MFYVNRRHSPLVRYLPFCVEVIISYGCCVAIKSYGGLVLVLSPALSNSYIHFQYFIFRKRFVAILMSLKIFN
jgi:hypothetical protein